MTDPFVDTDGAGAAIGAAVAAIPLAMAMAAAMLAHDKIMVSFFTAVPPKWLVLTRNRLGHLRVERISGAD
ncbi:hypothetical protein E3T61_12360 [Cryobacterium lactosi]|uniref:Uncharacterized protein n=1 Tax=Cryobacterium lactosi TaxID=1259202 RepID=A0A4R9BRV7_9MICO|nr:hypothetical protein [Cryobacterium lactosi]TFD88612.1 hypothetical protein E3T61_12360 [Cryobacterium lactosi]